MSPDEGRSVARSAVILVAIYVALTTLFAVFEHEYATWIAPLVQWGFNIPQHDLIVDRVGVEGGNFKITSTIAPDGLFGGAYGGRRIWGLISTSSLMVAPVLVLTLVLGYPKCTRGVRLVWLSLAPLLISAITIVATPLLTVGKFATTVMKMRNPLSGFLVQAGAIPVASIAGAIALYVLSEKIAKWWSTPESSPAESAQSRPDIPHRVAVPHAASMSRPTLSKGKRKRKR